VCRKFQRDFFVTDSHIRVMVKAIGNHARRYRESQSLCIAASREGFHQLIRLAFPAF
jgi:hypothetical protein